MECGAKRSKAPAEDRPLLSLLGAVGRVPAEVGLGSFARIEKTMRAGAMPPLHVHEEDELFHVLEGAMTIHAGDRAVRLGAGESFLAPKGVPHTYRAESERVRFLAVAAVASVGRYDEFLRAVAPATNPADGMSGLRWASAEESAALTVIASANRITVLGPPGALPSATHEPAGA